jgi:Flp pilus assembly protein TadG
MITCLSPRVRRFAQAESGVAAVEMALVMPVALALLSLIVASGQSLNYWRRTVAAAHTVTDLVSRTPDTTADPVIVNAEDLTQSALINDLALAQLVMYPGSTTSLQIVLTEIQVNTANNTGTVVWSQGYNGATPASCATVLTLNSNISAAGATYMLVGAVSYSFQPLGVTSNLPVMTFSASDMLTIRYAPQIVITNVTDTSKFNQCP